MKDDTLGKVVIGLLCFGAGFGIACLFLKPKQINNNTTIVQKNNFDINQFDIVFL